VPGKERLSDEQFSTMAGESDSAVNPLVRCQGSLLSETLTADIADKRFGIFVYEQVTFEGDRRCERLVRAVDADQQVLVLLLALVVLHVGLEGFRFQHLGADGAPQIDVPRSTNALVAPETGGPPF